MSFDIAHLKEQLENHTLEPIDGGKDVTGYYMRRGPSRIMSTLILFTREGIVITGDLHPGDNGVISCLGYGHDWFAGRLSERYLCEKFLKKGWYSEVAAAEIKDMIEQTRRGEYDSYSYTRIEPIADDRRTIHDEIVEARDRIKGLMKDGKDDDVVTAMGDLDDLWDDVREARTKVVDARQKFIDKLETQVRDVEYGDLDRGQFCDGWRTEINEDVEDIPGWDYEPSEAHWLCAIQQAFSRLYNAMKGTTVDA